MNNDNKTMGCPLLSVHSTYMITSISEWYKGMYEASMEFPRPKIIAVIISYNYKPICSCLYKTWPSCHLVHNIATRGSCLSSN